MSRPNWRWVALIAALALGTDVAAQDSHHSSLVYRTGWVRLEVLRGRLTVLPVTRHATETASLSDPQTGASESLAVSVEDGKATLRYQRTDASQQLSVDFVHGDVVSIHREPRGDNTVVPLHFTQGERGLSLEVGEGPDRRYATEPGLWRLILLHRDLCREHLLPVLESMRRDWTLLETADRAESALLLAVNSDLPAKRERCRQLVKQLASPSFQQRRAAYQELRTLGHATLAYVGNLDALDLDAEQRMRLRALSGNLDVQRGDTPDAVAAALLDDESVWRKLLESESASTRCTAAEQVKRIRGAAIDFDPDADAATRSRQLEQLRQEP